MLFKNKLTTFPLLLLFLLVPMAGCATGSGQVDQERSSFYVSQGTALAYASYLTAMEEDDRSGAAEEVYKAATFAQAALRDANSLTELRYFIEASVIESNYNDKQLLLIIMNSVSDLIQVQLGDVNLSDEEYLTFGKGLVQTSLDKLVQISSLYFRQEDVTVDDVHRKTLSGRLTNQEARDR